MCWMTARKEYDALAMGIIATKPHEEQNGHSWGYAYAEDGEIHIRKGVGEIPDDLDVPLVDNAIVHTRFATRGEVNKENAHPYAVEYDGEVIAALAHNGTWVQAPKAEGKSDTWMMARYFELLLRENDGDFETALKELTEKVGETIVVLHRDGTVYGYSGRFMITASDDGVIASSGHDVMHSGKIVKIPEEGSPIDLHQHTLYHKHWFDARV